ncbi:MAG: hypothetical protein ACYTE3_12850 [Planctomycetota bacterium]|jgi:hypothetical protein
MTKPYRPSNGTEGMIFEEEFCLQCKKDRYHETQDPADGCNILMRALAYNIEDDDYPEEWVWNPDQAFEDGALVIGGEFGPRCTAFEAKNER